MSEAPRDTKILYFKRRKPSHIPFLVYIEGRGEEYCLPFWNLDDALECIEEKEEDLGFVCSLFQNLPLEDEDIPSEYQDD